MSRFFLVVTEGDSSLRYALRDGIQTLGRASDCDIQLADSSVSKRHVEIELAATQIVVRDLDSKNGTFVNETPVKSKSTLCHGDSLRLGSLHMELLDTEEHSHSRLAPEDRVCSPYSTSSIDVQASMLSRQPKRALEAVHEAGQTLAQTLTLDALFQQMLLLISRHFTADRILIFEGGADGSEPRVVASQVQGRSANEPLRLSRTLLGEVLVGGRSLLTKDAAADDRFAGHKSIIDSGIHSAMAAPLFDKCAILGMIYIDSLRRAVVYSPDELRLLTLLANMTAVKATACRLEETERERQRLLRELELASRIQRKLVPQEVPTIPGYAIFAHMTPCNEIGGDLFDIRPRGDGRVWLAVGDVSGKGIAAALLMANVMAALRFLEDDGGEPLVLVERLHSRLLQNVEEEQFLTLFSALLEPESGRVVYVNAGHVPPIHVDAESWRPLDSTALPVALLPSISPQAAETTLAPGETLLIFSDGLSETSGVDEQQYGETRLGRFLDENGRLGADDLGRCLLADVESFRSAPHAADDLTLLIVERL